MLTAINAGDLGFSSFLSNRAPPGPSLPPSSWQPPPRYYAGPPSTTLYTPPVNQGPTAVNRPPTVNRALVPGANLRPPISSFQPPPRYYAGPPSTTPYTPPVNQGPTAVNRPTTVNTAYSPGANYRPVNPTPTPAPSVSSPVASPVALKGLPPASQFKPPQLPSGLGGGAGAAAGLLTTLPQLAGAVADAARSLGGAAGAAYGAGATGGVEGRGNLAVALTLFPLAPFALAGLAERQGRPEYIPDWLWPFPEPPGPNETDPAAMDAGAQIVPGVDPPFLGGQSPGVQYQVSYTVRFRGNNLQQFAVETRSQLIPSGNYYGPLSGFTRQMSGNVVSYPGTYRNASGQTVQAHLNLGGTSSRDLSNGSEYYAEGFTTQRVDGQIDTGGNPPGGIDPVRAPNPARQSASGTPRPLPSPLPPPAPSDLPWPQTAPQKTPDTTPLSPPTPVPNFNTTPTLDPVAPTAPGTTPQPTDLESPRETPPNLGEDPLTPPVKDPLQPLDKAAPTAAPKSALSALNNPLAPLVVAIPVVLIDGLRQKVNTPTGDLLNRSKPNPNIQVVKPPPPPTVTTPNPPTCIYERERVRDIQNKATDVQEKASNPVSGFPGLYGIGIESRVKLGQTFTLMESVNQFMRKAWQTTRMQKVLDVLTFIGVMHNVSMLSREVGETFFYLVSQGLDIVGIDDEEGNALDIGQIVGKSVNAYLVSVFGEAFVDGARDSYRKANRIVQSASMVIWSIRSIQDSSLDLMEWVAENTGKIGNALKRFGVVGDRAYPWMSEQAQARDRNRARFSKLTDTLENAEDRLSSYTTATSNILETTQEVNELGQNWGSFKESLNDAPNPWFDNDPVKDKVATETAASTSPNITAADTQKTE